MGVFGYLASYLKILLVFLCLAQIAVTKAAEGTITQLHGNETEPEFHIPEALYIWTSHKNLARTKESLDQGRGFLLDYREIHKRNGGYDLFRLVPGLLSKKLRFTWIHPVAGIALDENEIYGKGEALIKVLLNRSKINAVLAVDTADGEGIPRSNKAVQTADLILHSKFKRLEDGSTALVYSEWILLNESAISKIVLDQSALRPEIESALKQLGSKFPRHLEHSPIKGWARDRSKAKKIFSLVCNPILNPGNLAPCNRSFPTSYPSQRKELP